MDTVDRSADWYEPLDVNYVRGLLDSALTPIIDRYFRPRLIGASRLPERGPLILAVNHSGTAFPYDAMVLDAVLWRRDGFEPASKFRSMFEKELTVTWWMRPFGLDNFWRKAGGVDQTFDNFGRLLARGDRVIYYPEGVPGIGKGFRHRYELQDFKTSFVFNAARHNAPVYPVYIINAEWIMPFHVTWRPLDRLMQRFLHVPFLPVPLGCFLPLLLPFTWYLAFPARMVMIVGDPIDVASRVREAGVTDFDSIDRRTAKAVAEGVRREMQEVLDKHVRRYGRWPYQARSLRRHLRRAKGRVATVLPIGWAPAFIRYDRDSRRPPARNRLRRVLRDWDLAGFYLPLGWLLLALARRFRRQPCGYRGMDPAVRRRQEGVFHWHLERSPLPPRDLVFPKEKEDAEGRGAATGSRRPPRGATAAGRALE